MIEQTYQQLTQEILKELPNVKGNIQIYFYKIKKENPKRFERLFYNTNGHIPHSEDLENILFDLSIAGLYKYRWQR
jgi:hypothetical protein